MIVLFLLFDVITQIQLITFSVLSEIITEMNNHTLSTHFGIVPTETKLSFVNSIITTSNQVGNALSILLLLPVVDYKGRKFVAVYLRFALIFSTGICHLLAALFQASEVFILGQFLLGVQTSLRFFATQMFIVESSPDNCRGFASASLAFAFVISKLVMFSSSSPSLLGTSDLWFIYPVFEMITATIIFCLMLHLPESPKWLIQQDKLDEAKMSIKFYHGKKCTIDEIVTSFIKERNLTNKNKISLKEVWDNETLREGLKIVFAVLLFLEFDTSYVTSVYTIDFHKSAGFTVQQALNINLIITTVLFPTKFIGTFLLDALGRRPVLAIAGIIQFSRSCLILSVEIIIYAFGSSWLTRIMFVVVESLSPIASATGVNSIRLLLTMELFPSSARTVVGQAKLFGSMLIGTPIVSLFPIINSLFPPIFFVPFVITQLLLGIYLFRHMPETRGRAVYDIIESLDRNVASRAASINEEKTPLIKNRARTFGAKRNSILNTPRSRALTFDHKFDSEI